MAVSLTKWLAILAYLAFQVHAKDNNDTSNDTQGTEACSCDNEADSKPYVPIFSDHTNPLWNPDDRDPLNRFQPGNNNSYSPPFPWAPARGVGVWADAIQKAKKFISDNQLTLEEKIALGTGVGWEEKAYKGRACVGNTPAIERVGYKGLCLEDSPTGVRSTDGVSVFPAGINIASTFDRDLMYQRGSAMGSEFKAKGVNIALGPGELRVLFQYPV